MEVDPLLCPHCGVEMRIVSVARSRGPGTIEDNAVIYANATILGGETVIGKGAVIGGNCWITKSVEAGKRVVV